MTGTDVVDSPSVGAAGTGEFVVAWARWVASDALTFARAFSRSGDPLTGEFQVNSDPSSEPYETAAAMNDGGEFAVVFLWVTLDPGSPVPSSVAHRPSRASTASSLTVAIPRRRRASSARRLKARPVG